MGQRKTWNKQKVIDAIRERERRGLSMENVSKYDKRLVTAARKYFGSWHAALLAAGQEVLQPARWNKEEIMKQIRWWHSKGVPPSQIFKHDHKLRDAGCRHFGKWNNAVRAAGFPVARRWSKRRVLLQIRVRHQQGLSLQAINDKDSSLGYAALRYFGGWHKAVSAAGIEPQVRRKWSQKAIIEEIQSRHTQGLCLRNLSHYYPALGYAATRYFGSMNKAFLAAGLEPPTRTWSRQRIIDEIKAWHSKGLPFSKIGRDYPALLSASARYFGSIQKALLAAGFESKPNNKWSEQKVISELQAWHKGNSHKKTSDANHNRLIDAALRYFGSWSNALLAAGLQPKPRGKWSKQRVVEEIQNLHVKGLLIQAAAEQNSHLSIVALRYFSSWENALEAAGIPHQVDMPRRKTSWSAERVISAIQTRYEQGLSMDCMRVNDPRLSCTAKIFFSGWGVAMDAAGFQLEPLAWNKQRIIAEIRIRHCPDMGTSKMGTDDMNLYNAAKDHFGNWCNALRAAGIAPDTVRPKTRRQWTKQKVIDEMQARHREGLFMFYTWPANRFLASAASKYFGGWHNALRAAGISPEVTKRKWQKKSKRNDSILPRKKLFNEIIDSTEQ